MRKKIKSASKFNLITYCVNKIIILVYWFILVLVILIINNKLIFLKLNLYFVNYLVELLVILHAFIA